jgi:hypothetical protein
MLPGREHDSDRIDRAIDEVAQRMTEGASSADLKSRVFARIEQQDTSPSRWRIVWLAAPIVAAAMIALIVFARQEGPIEKPFVEPSIARRSDQPLPPAPQPETARAVTQADASPPRAAAVNAPRDSVYRAIPTQSSRAPSEVEALTPPGLTVPSIAVPSMAIGEMPTTSIAVEPLETITPMALTPIGAGDRQ